MNKLIDKLRSTRGETLAEILVSIALLGLSIALMLTMVMTSSKITQKARKADNDLISELNAAEQQSGSIGTAYVTIKDASNPSDSINVQVNIYKDTTSTAANPLISYSTD